MLTKDQIVHLLKTNDKAVARALVVLNSRQTAEEQATENTRFLNGAGFRPCHARMGTSMAKQFERKGYLSQKQINYWRVLDKTGSMRIGIYWKQLAEAAEEKAKKKTPINVVVRQTAIQLPPDVTGDYNTDVEAIASASEILASGIYDKGHEVVKRLEAKIKAIHEYWYPPVV